MQNKKGFTLVELVIVVAIIAVVSAVLIPAFTSTYQAQKENIVEIYNGNKVICCCDDQVIYEGDKSNIPDFVSQGYLMTTTDYREGIVYLYFTKKDGD